MRTLRGALRNDWPIPDDVKQRLLQSLINLCDPETVEGQLAGARTRLSAMKTLLAAAKLTLQQAALDVARSRSEPKRDGPVALADLVAEAERRAEARRLERAREDET